MPGASGVDDNVWRVAKDIVEVIAEFVPAGFRRTWFWRARMLMVLLQSNR